MNALYCQNKNKHHIIKHMKRYIATLLIALFLSCASLAQSLVGDWQGTLNVGPGIPLVLHIDPANSVTLDSPAQGATGMACTSSINGDSIEWSIATLLAHYKGTLCGDSLKGTFTQGGMSFPLHFGRKTVAKAAPKPYKEEVFTCSHHGISLAGTLTIPQGKGPFPAVVLVAGSGALDRDETILGHKPFKVLADSLTRRGIVVARYDKRGVGKSSIATGYETTNDYATDAHAVLQHLQSLTHVVDSHRLGMIGHSEGGSITIMQAAEGGLDFAILMAAPAVKGKELMIKQNEWIVKLQGMPWTAQRSQQVTDIFTAIDTSSAPANLKTQLNEMAQAIPFLQAQIPALTSPWYINFVKTDPTQNLQRIECPVLALNGEWDAQVDCEQNLGNIARLVKNATVKRYPQFNHFFQHCNKLESSMGYGFIAEDLNPQVIDDIAQFILNLPSHK